MTHQASMRVQRQQILGLLGVVRWVGANVPTWHITPSKTDRFMLGDGPLTASQSQQEINTLSVQIPTEPSPKPATVPPDDAYLAINNSADLPTNLPKLSNVINARSEQANDGAIQEKSVKSAGRTVITYELDGVRVGEWVLVVDVGVIGREEQSVWMSLKSALSTWADEHKVNFHTHHIRYPMSDELVVSQSLAQKCFDGFVLRLQMMGDFTQKVAFLSALVDDVDYFGESVALPMLSQMTQNPSDKKVLWRQVIDGLSQ